MRNIIDNKKFVQSKIIRFSTIPYKGKSAKSLRNIQQNPEEMPVKKLLIKGNRQNL